MKAFTKKIVLENGREFYGYGFGADREAINEIVFNTSMVGYQEIMSDPSYTDQMVVMTYPLIGNYGIADEDFESRTPTIGGLVVREYNDNPSNFRYTKTLSEILEENHIPGISGVDTRKITRSIRDLGSRRVLITSADTPTEEALRIIAASPVPHDAVPKVSCRKKWYSRTSNHKFNVVAVDCGIKLNIVRSLNARGCNVTVVPWNTASSEIEKMKPDGIFLSNGPGDPEDVTPVIELVRELRGRYPIFGICLGHQMISLAYGARTYKLKFGHRGGNHPVKNQAVIKTFSDQRQKIIDGIGCFIGIQLRFETFPVFHFKRYNGIHTCSFLPFGEFLYFLALSVCRNRSGFSFPAESSRVPVIGSEIFLYFHARFLKQF